MMLAGVFQTLIASYTDMVQAHKNVTPATRYYALFTSADNNFVINFKYRDILYFVVKIYNRYMCQIIYRISSLFVCVSAEVYYIYICVYM